MHLNPIVRLDHVSIIRNSNRILHDIDLCIDHGQHWAIIGQNGSGKTSLISIINGYHQPSQGKACALGRKFGSTDLRELRLHIGECSSEIRNMIHQWEPVRDIVLSGKFASIGLYETPSAKNRKHFLPGRSCLNLNCCFLMSHAQDLIASGAREEVLTNEVLIRTFEVPVELHEKGGRLWVVVY